MAYMRNLSYLATFSVKLFYTKKFSFLKPKFSLVRGKPKEITEFNPILRTQ